MSTVILCHAESVNLDTIRASDANIIRYSVGVKMTELKDMLKQYTAGRIRNLGLHIQTRDTKLRILEDMEVTKESLENAGSFVSQFFRWLISEVLIEGAFIDFLLTTPIENASQICLAVQSVSKKKISVRLVSRFLSSELAPHNRRIVEIYINNEIMITNPNPRATSAQNRYERIRTVGKGAFGSAVLYRRREDSSLVIIKEINMYDLDSSQRRLALNEVSLLSRIEHPNIIAYYDSFEEEGVLMIEMEYADGGTLAQMLSRTQNLLDEEQIGDMMIQMCSAVAYLHENSVLHRDLKTANVFLTRDSFVKIGDFGISKIMGTETLAQGAKTVVGTPYYISPEMCSGVSYNEKSDMWALGCILYEMCCLKKAFEGDNLPALVNSIMTCAYTPVKGPYSAEMKMVIRELLQLDPQKRPSAPQALKMLRPSENRHRHTSGSMRSSVSFTTLYDLHVPTITLSSIPDLPSRISIKQVALSKTHTMVLTNDNELFGFGDNSCGQLGFGKFSKMENGRLVESLKGRDIQSVGVGNYFSVICCDRGTLLTFGTAKNLGLGKDAKDSAKPMLLEQLLRENIKDIYCGHDHVVAVLESGECLGWGSNQYGQLGLPTLEHFFAPTKIPMPSNKKIVYGKAGKDATMLLSDDGSLIAMGSNKHNKLNLTQRVGFFTKEKKTPNDYVNKPTILQGFPERVVDFSVGSYHSGVILESGQVMIFGRNDNTELGLGNSQKMAVRCVKPVKSLLHHACTHVLCGDGFTLVSTTEQELYFWGRKDLTDEDVCIDDLEETVTEKKMKRGTTTEIFDKNVVTLPSLILRLQDERGDKGIRLSGLAVSGRKVHVAVDMLEGKRLPSALAERCRSGSAPAINDETTHTWLREEFEKAEIIPIDASKRRVRFDDSCEKLKIMDATAKQNSLLREIEDLKSKIKEQDTTFEGHRNQMSDLESKLQELQAKQSFLRKSEPPPAYDRRNVTYNKLFPERENTSTTCVIL
ncbi:non-specific serine/threonine protein kinase [Caenorhabditis elegans]|uniref:non-specific serine/threonine protein kinase n=2 Tax=Caenorhabditis elegans TaxID=6239 RepID=A0A061AD48_CAEEL|nr:Protein kinase domain-containing protein [Caenorhabditis elegans]CDR32820.1 Protein kinase domain-containing protein [Caenorhabditis elegans]|eukprot:NP_001293320.1 NEK (NEver in mitosis Kinase) Like [Caenorhabditis elegans]